VIAAGIESMSRVPMGSSLLPGRDPFGPALHARYPGLVPQGLSAELIAERWGLTREELDAFALGSHRKAARAIDDGRFEREIIGVPAPEHPETLLVVDEGVRRDTSPERLAALKPSFRADGVVTAGNSSQITDGAAAVLVASEEAAGRLGLRPRARFDAFAVVGADPVLMLTAPIPATAKVLERGKRHLDDMDLIEINEAFASVVLAWEREVHPDPERVNVNGGAIALGHPLGCSGARLMATLLCELERSGRRFGLQTMCEGGGMANAAIIERL
jgi:acetyl-CoA acetyltransferase family protein